MIHDTSYDVGEVSSCFSPGNGGSGCLDVDTAGVAAGGEEPVFESLAGECARGTMGAVAYVLYWGAGKLSVMLRGLETWLTSGVGWVVGDGGGAGEWVGVSVAGEAA